LRERYISLQANQVMSNFIHDRDLLILLDSNLNDFKKQIKVMENMAKKFKLKVPSRPPSDFKISQKINEISDKMIYKIMYNDFLAQMQGLIRAIRTSTTNDDLRNVFMKFYLGHLENFVDWFKFGKLKGWADIAPAFITFKAVEAEKLSVNEADHLWNHITQRYDNLQQTQFYLTFIHDPDFKVIVQQGQMVLQQQIERLEKEANHFEVPLPERPPAIMESPVDPEIVEDRYMYRIVLKGMQAAIELHSTAAVETTRNDKLRGLFVGLLKKELTSFDKFLKFGKAKGWTKVEPMYKF